MRKVRILVIAKPALAQLVVYLLESRPEFQVLRSIGGLNALKQQSGRLFPDLIVARVRPLSAGVGHAAALIKQYSPSSKLILICPATTFAPDARKCGADAFLDEEKLVGRLLQTALVVSGLSEGIARRFPGLKQAAKEKG
jgi:hypothetical protein